jgi:glycosyltransferase involved in cell wall biosynthesis
MRLAVWSPAPPSRSGIADYVAEQLEPLARHHAVEWVRDEHAAGRPEAELDVYHVGNSPDHAFVYRAALARPGVVVLHDFSLHDLVRHETLGRGDAAAYRSEMRRAHGPAGSFVARQVARGLGGELLPALFTANDRLLEASLAVVALTRVTAQRVAARLPGRPVLHLPHHLALPLSPPPSRAEARRALGLEPDALVVTAPGLATRAKRLELGVQVVARLHAERPALRLVVAGAVEPGLPLAEWAQAAGLGDALRVTGRLSLEDFERHLAAADIVLALRFPSRGEMSGALVRALGVGRPALVTAGTAAAEEFPEGVVVPVAPGPRERGELEALIGALADEAGLRDAIGRVARAHVRRQHDREAGVERLAGFLEQVSARREALLDALAAARVPQQGLAGYLLGELRWSARQLGLPGLPAAAVPLVVGLAPEAP